MTAVALMDLAAEYERVRQYTKAEPLYARALGIYEKARGPDHPETGRSVEYLGLLYQHTADFAKAEPLLQRGLRICEKALGPDHPQTAICLDNVAYLYQAMGDYAKAEPLHQRALTLLEKGLGPEHPDTAMCLNNLGLLYEAMVDFARAEPLFQRSLKIREKVHGPEHPNTAKGLENLAGLYKLMGDYAKAEPLLQRALKVREKVLGLDHPETAQSLDNLGALYEAMGHFVEAETLMKRALTILETVLGPDHSDTATSLNNLAAIYWRLGEYAKAEPIAQRSLRIYEKTSGPNHPATAMALNILGLLSKAMGDYPKAELFFKRALRIREETLGSEHPDTAVSFHNLAVLSLDMGNATRALEAIKKAQQADLKTLAKILSFSSEEQRLAFQATLHPYSLFAVLENAPELAQAILRHKGVVLDSLLEDRVVAQASKRPEQRAQLEQLRAAKQGLMQSRLEASKDVNEPTLQSRSTEREKLANQVEELEGVLARQGAALGRSRKSLSVTVEQVQKGIPKQSVLVEIIRYSHYKGTNKWEDRYGAIIIASAGEPKWISLGTASLIETNIVLYQSLVRGGARERGASLLSALHHQLWAPLEPALPKDTKTIILSPDGALNFLSFATLLTPEDMFLSQKYSIRYVSSGRDLLRERRPVRGKRMAIYANPHFSGQALEAKHVATTDFFALRGQEMRELKTLPLPPLPGTAKESAALVAQAKNWNWPTEVYLDAAASEAQLRTVDSPYILHLATHGFFLPEEQRKETELELGWRGIGGVRPTMGGSGGLSVVSSGMSRPIVLKNPMHRSGLALAGAQTTLEAWKRGETPPTENDGIVTAEEVGGLKLDGTWLVTLSACDTGVGEARSGEGVLGLRRGFIQAGAQNLLMTLWSVSDEQTAKLMVDFYTVAEKTGSAPQALADVQRDWLIRLRHERGLSAAVQLAGPFILSSQGEMK